MKNGITKSIPRIDAEAKARGEAPYIADIPNDDCLYARFVRSTVTRGTIRNISIPELPAGYYTAGYQDVQGENSVVLINRDWPVFAEKEVRYIGQIIMVVVGPDAKVLDSIIKNIQIDYKEMTPAVTIEEGLSLKGGAIHGTNNLYADYQLKKGNPEAAYKNADNNQTAYHTGDTNSSGNTPYIIEEIYQTGFQEQMYMEPQGIVVRPENGRITLSGSMQCPYYVKHTLETALGLKPEQIHVVQTVTGGAFGGKEDYPEIMGAPLAVAAWKLQKPLKMIFDRSEDLAYTSKRHPSKTRVRTALDKEHNITAMDIDIIIDGGAYESYSCIVLQRAIFTSNGVYNFPNASVRGRAVATNTVPSGAFRGFGAPQALFALEAHMDLIARRLGKNPLTLRKQYVAQTGDTTITNGHFKETIVMDNIIDRIEKMSAYSEKYPRYAQQKKPDIPNNAIQKPLSKPLRGIGIALLNHGCGFTGDGEQRIIKAKASLKKTAEGAVEILIANIDMGQGPTTTLRKVVGRILNIAPQDITYNNPDTDNVPDSGPTVASRTMMIVGYLLQEAAKKLKNEWQDGTEQTVTTHYTMPPELVWNQDNFSGDAYPAYGWGANAIEVEVDPVTFEVTITGAWAVYDVGIAIDEKVVLGQIQGGMSQALGYGAMENLDIRKDGTFRQVTMADYIIPTSMDFPRTEGDTVDNPYQYGPFGAKGMGEMVHGAAHAALANAVSQAIGRDCTRIPLTPEQIMEFTLDEHNNNS